MATGPCDACWRTSSVGPDRHRITITDCGRALCDDCGCGQDCYDRHDRPCARCIQIDNHKIVKEISKKARMDAGVLFYWEKRTVV